MTTYASTDYKTKKALREAIAAGTKVTVFNPGLGGPVPRDGTVTLSGPHFPKPHTWYATATIEDGYIVRIK